MEERKILTGMLLFALVISVVGTLFTFDQLEVYKQDFTGAATGQVDLNITEEISISLPNSTIDFGNGVVDLNSSFAVVDSREIYDTDGGTWANISDNITVRNDGNVGVNITIQSNVTRGNESDSFICQGDSDCGSAFENNSGPQLNFAVIWADNEEGSCAENLQTNAQPFVNPTGAVGSTIKGCGCLKASSTEDEIAASLKIGIPDDASGEKFATLTISATTSGSSC